MSDPKPSEAEQRDGTIPVIRGTAGIKPGADHFSAIFNTSSLGIALVGVEEESFIRGNDAFSRLTGYEGAALAGMSYRQLVHPDDLAAVKDQLDSLHAGASACEMISRIICRDGRITRVKAKVTLVPDPSGDSLVWTIEGISAEEQAREEEYRMRFLADHSSEYISLADPDGRLTYMNAAARAMVGIAADADPGMSTDYASPAELERIRKEVLPYMEKEGYWEGRLNMRHRSTGEDIPVHVKSLLIRKGRDGKPAGRATVARDLRPELEATAAIQEREDRLQNAIELARLGTWSMDLASGLIEYSDRVRDLYGLPPGPLPMDGMFGIHPDDVAGVQAAMERALQTPAGGIYDSEHRALHPKTGEIRWVHSQGRVVYDRAGKPCRIIGSLQDVTRERQDRQALERQVELHTEELYKANQQLQDLNSYLQQSNSELEQYAYVASHDLQEPLRKILVFAGMLSKIEGLPQEAIVAIGKINLASSRMMQLIRDLLDFSRLLKAERMMRPVDLNAVLAAVLTDFDLQIAEKGAVIDADELPTIEAVGLQMNQLFYNLISNAMKFSRADVPPRIEIRCRILDEGAHAVQGLHDERIIYYYITLADNGIGFDSQYSEQIFEVFKRLHTQAVYPGSGIGLALCRRILQNHGGIMTAQSQEGAGTTISMIIPSRQLVSHAH